MKLFKHFALGLMGALLCTYSAQAAQDWQVSMNVHGDEQYFPCPGIQSIIQNKIPMSASTPVHGTLIPPSLSGMVNTSATVFGLFGADLGTVLNNALPVYAQFQTGYYRDPSPDGSWIDLQVQWIGAGAPPANAKVKIYGTVFAIKNNVPDQGTSAALSFQVSDLINEISSPNQAIITAPLIGMNASTVYTPQQVFNLANGYGHFMVRFQTNLQVLSPGNPPGLCSVQTGSRLYCAVSNN